MSAALEVNTKSFNDEVIQSPTPVLVDFWASWCMPCKMLGPVIDEIAGDYAGKVKVAKVNVDSDGALAAQFGIQGIPTLLIFKDGQLIDRIVGLQQKSEIAQKLNAVLR